VVVLSSDGGGGVGGVGGVAGVFGLGGSIGFGAATGGVGLMSKNVSCKVGKNSSMFSIGF
jgi:hypothetical protein